MRSLLLIPLIAASVPARAGAATYTPFVDLRKVDAPCRALAEVPATATTPGPSLDAAISTANCMVATRTRGLQLEPTAAAADELDQLVAPAIEILDHVIQAGDVEHKLIAHYAKADILLGNTARLLATLPELSPQMGSREVQGRYKLVLVADGLTLRWRQRALASQREIARLAYLHPEVVVKNPVVARMVVDTRMGRAAGVAER